MQDTSLYLTHRQTFNLIKAIGHKRTVLVRGEAGSGKTSICYELAQDFPEYKFVKPIDCTQLSEGSVWMPDIDRDKGVSRELPNERFGVHRGNHKGIDEAVPVIIGLDEIGKARQHIKDALAPIILERRVGDYLMPDNSILVAFSNLDDEGIGDNFQAHMRDRLVKVQMRKPTQEEWMADFALPRALNAEVIAATQEYPEVFKSFMDYKDANDIKANTCIYNPRLQQEAWVTPRSLHAASDIVEERADMDETTLHAALAGTVGAEFAAKLLAFIRFGNDLPDWTRLVNDPANCPMPKNPTARIVMVFKAITKVKSVEDAAAVVEYVGRMSNEMRILFVFNVARASTQLKHFVMVKEYGALMAEQRKFLNI